MNPRRRTSMPPQRPKMPRKPQGRPGHYPYYPHYWDDYYYWDYYSPWNDYYWNDYYWDDYYYYSGEQKPQRKNRPTKQIQSITVDAPLMIRLLEFAREDATSDMDLHEVVERMIEISEFGESLTMENYEDIVDLSNYSSMQPPPSKSIE